MDDDPIPRAVVEVLHDFDATQIYEALQEIPQRQSASYDDRVKKLAECLPACGRKSGRNA